ncbi:similar to Saccharomyces cerevisiae YHL039W EFM1 Probable lysine methyltransferase involved in the monomethylation of eEF1A (Tef1p/Tef2p) [Maudiozyma saulgeensis]|uniref:Similar to Saccharomyces cerevisiae YHL039W EFM1 Probable lysine methyltransferase involved in the monomethylation of eEF1A (Tef1p/Tef2p) n=1 Tax=Maudiozyma saulgeensis TaxID=1789683 RepID=A0A1X7R490_9SACH|nr:similar to Saccharomyces cerevisiae YHL039W EFM1 Probable lysine methyltransferase involved in the monomethylation of eEF1A (Tef1p/Tef2p) [Kazachstania saulgeensis]
MINTGKLDNLIKWSKENGSIIDDAIKFNISAGNGAYACITNPNKIDSLNDRKLISIPSSLLITKKLALESFCIETDEDQNSNLNALTQLYLCQLKFQNESQPEILLSKQNFFKFYLDTLPKHLTHPYFWTEENLELLKKTDIYVLLKQNLTSLKNEWKAILNLTGSKPFKNDIEELLYKDDCDFNDEDTLNSVFEYIQQSLKIFDENMKLIHWNSFFAYLWAFCIFSSRAFPEIVINPDCKNINQAFLMPIIDLLNHKNDTKTRWTFSENKVNFISNELNFKNTKGTPNDQLYNNYGDKSNEELLLGYGFVEEANKYDYCRLTLRLDDSLLKDATQKQGIKLTSDNLIAPGCVQFKLSYENSLPLPLFQLFGFLCKLRSEDNLTYRSVLEGSDELNNVISSKLSSVKQLIKSIKGSDGAIQTLKSYLNSQRRILNTTMEALAKKQKITIKEISQKDIISFKTIFKSDKVFANAMLLRFGVIKFEDLISKGVLNKALMLWIVRIANKDTLDKKLEYQIPDFIIPTFREVASNIVVEKDDVMEYMSFYKELFPHLAQKLPDVFGKGDWGIKQFIIADSVIDRIVWIKKTNQEPFFLEKAQFQK